MKKTKIIMGCLLMAFLLWGCSFAEWKNKTDDVLQDVSEINKESEKVESISTEAYVYQTLDDETKQVYDEVLDAILAHKKSVAVSAKDKEMLEKAYYAVNADYGGLFWVSGYMYTQHYRGDNMIGIDFAPTYSMSKEEREKTQEKIDQELEEILSGVSSADSDYTKVKYVYETLIKRADYVPGAENNQNIISVFLNGETVCQGYACATQYLLKLLGIQSAIITGKADGEAHAWNLVRMDGEYYYVDTTWGNSRYLSEDRSEEKYVNYNYLGVTGEEISSSHQAENTFPLPECISSQNNYFVHEGLYFDVWDPDAIGGLYANAWKNGEKKVAVKFSSRELYDKAVEFFIKEERIANYCDGITTMYYIEDKEQRILTISF